MNKNKGFTLIELLVVIAIIGVLSSVVLASLNSARAKGSDAAVKSNLNNIRAQAELFYDDTPNSDSYFGVCDDPTFKKVIKATGGNCKADKGYWVMAAPLKNGAGFWCVDYKGSAVKITEDLASGATKCE